MKRGKGLEGPIQIFVSVVSLVLIAGHSPNCNLPPGTVVGKGTLKRQS